MEPPPDNALIGTEAIKAFTQEFGSMDDIINRIILEEVLKNLLDYKEEEHGKTKTSWFLFLFCKKR